MSKMLKVIFHPHGRYPNTDVLKVIVSNNKSKIERKGISEFQIHGLTLRVDGIIHSIEEEPIEDNQVPISQAIGE